jgi:archaellin
MDRATTIDVGSANSIGYMDGSGNGGGAGGLTYTDTLVVKSTRSVLELTPQLGAPLTIQWVIPPGLRNVMNLN